MDRLRRPRLEDPTEGSVGPDRGLHPTVVVSLQKTRRVSVTLTRSVAFTLETQAHATTFKLQKGTSDLGSFVIFIVFIKHTAYGHISCWKPSVSASLELAT